MSNYSNVLLALDLNSNLKDVIQRACEFAQSQSAKLTVLNVVEYLPIDPTAELMLSSPAILEAELVDLAQERIAAAIAALPDEAKVGLQIRCSVLPGNIRDLIMQTAKDSAHDLIIVGRQQRHGLALLLGRTEDAVLHHANCDVLAITL
jgi:universal stress protein A